MLDIRGLPDLPDFKKNPPRGREGYNLTKQEALLHALWEQYVASKFVQAKKQRWQTALGQAHEQAVNKQIEFRKALGMPRLTMQRNAEAYHGGRMTFADGKMTVLNFEDGDFVGQNLK